MITSAACLRASLKARARRLRRRHDVLDAGQAEARGGEFVADEDSRAHVSRPG